MPLALTQNGNDFVFTLGTTSKEPFGDSGPAKTPDVYRDGVLVTNCHASATVYVKVKGTSTASTDLTTTRYNYVVNAGKTLTLQTRDLFYILSDTASTPVAIMEYREVNGGNGQ